MRVVSAAEMRAIDRRASDEIGIPGVVLMEAAGIALARACVDAMDAASEGKRIAIFCGKGNNGGDGFVAARHLSNAGSRVTVFRMGEAKGDAGVHAAAIGHMVNIEEVSLSDADFRLDSHGRFDLIVDALLGTGGHAPLDGVLSDLVAQINDYARDERCPIIACDLPTGVDSDTGYAEEPVIHATRTVTFARPKPGLIVYPGADYVGQLTVADIGIPNALFDELPGPKISLTTQNTMCRLLPPRTESRDANKGTYGTVLVIAGSAGMAGASALTALSALRAGAGLVMLAVPASLLDTAAALAPEAILRPLPETPDRTHGGPGAVEAALKLAEAADAVAIGPGLSGNPEAAAFVQQFVRQVRKPLIIDADGLNAIAKHPEVMAERGTLPTVLTPHPGEMGRLLNRRTADVQADRFAAVREGASRYGAVALLKGSRTLIATPDGDAAVNARGSAALGTAGSGDVLTGVIGALLGHKLSAFDAARAGAYLHAVAGECAAEAIGVAGVLAGDVRDRLPQARQRLYSTDDLDAL